MKNISRTVSAVALAAGMASLALPASAANLVVNGTFSTPNVGGSWNLFPNGAVPGWTSNNNEIEIDSPGAVGMPCISAGCQSAEWDGTTFDTISQTVTGLTPGRAYTLSWEYGDRGGSGPQETDVSFGGSLVTQDSNASMSPGTWSLNTFTVTATATSEILSFAALDTSSSGGNPSIANELTGVSLISEPVSLALLGARLAGLGLIRRRRAG
jgi:hypothetical protein